MERARSILPGHPRIEGEEDPQRERSLRGGQQGCLGEEEAAPRPAGHRSPASRPPTLFPVALVETIVVAYDDPESGTLSRAAELAEAFGASLVVTNVVPPEHDEEAEAERYGRERLEQARTFLESRG